MQLAKIKQIKTLNETLDPKRELSGLFLPVGEPEQFDVMFVAEMPSMNVPKGWVLGDVIPNFSETKRDRFLQDMMVKYGVGGSYVTDIVKTRDYPRQPTPGEVTRWLPFLLKEIEIIQPRTLVVLGKRTYESSFIRFVARHVPKNIKVHWVFHYSNQVPRKKFEERFREVVGKIERA
jgi:uracil-DNA glycosylase family 4